ncbi:MAG: DUF1385 domain-containing protein [Halanaerobiales bacterium]|nr:DUF1385 domain-containing protein [Halanaerobiales bacterium]
MSKEVDYGGQAVIEGVMMKGLNRLAIAVRKPDNSIVVKKRNLTPLSEKYKFLGWPFIRGVVALFSSLILGMQSLSFAANQATEEDEELTPIEMGLTILVSLGLAILLFVALPAGIIALIQKYISYNLVLNLIEGLIKVSAFLLYIIAISRLDDIKRVFMYHGAEHKVIHNYESGKDLSVENAREFTTLHARCGTNFLFIVIILSILFFSFFGRPPVLYRILYHLMLLPVIAGTSYEVIKLAGGKEVNPIIKVLATPGLWLQKLTTSEPDDDMLEVAITALENVLPGEERGEQDV